MDGWTGKNPYPEDEGKPGGEMPATEEWFLLPVDEVLRSQGLKRHIAIRYPELDGKEIELQWTELGIIFRLAP